MASRQIARRAPAVSGLDSRGRIVLSNVDQKKWFNATRDEYIKHNGEKRWVQCMMESQKIALPSNLHRDKIENLYNTVVFAAFDDKAKKKAAIDIRNKLINAARVNGQIAHQAIITAPEKKVSNEVLANLANTIAKQVVAGVLTELAG